jgi:ABC-2 family transporter
MKITPMKVRPVGFSWRRVGAILRKELRDYRRNRFVIGTMVAAPAVFIVLPMIQLFVANATGNTAHLDLRIGLSLLYMLVIPVTVPSAVSAYSVVGEREQGTLEPVLTTPIRREEFLIGKALAAFVPTLVIAYAVFGIFLAVAALLAHPVIVSAIAGHPCLDVAERDQRIDAARDRARRRAAGPRPARLARRGCHVRPRTARDRQTCVTLAAGPAWVAEPSGKPPIRRKGDQPCPQR